MTLENTNRLAIHRGNGAATNFPYTFPIYEATDLAVQLQDFVTGEILETLSSSQYSVTGIGDTNGGTVTYPLSGTPLADEFNIVILRTVPYVQPLQLQNYGGFYPETLEDQLDRIVMQTQQLAEQVDRMVVMAPGATTPLQFALNIEDGDVLMREGDMIKKGPDADQIASAQGYAETAGTLLAEATELLEETTTLVTELQALSRAVFKSPQLLVADNTLSYAAGADKLVVAPGDIVSAGVHFYTVTTVADATADILTAGGVSLHLMKNAEGRYALSGLGLGTNGPNVTTALKRLLARIRSVGFPESIVIDGWWTINEPIRSPPYVRWYGSGLGLLRAVSPFGNVRFEVAAHDTIPAGTDIQQPMIWMAESPVTPAALVLDPTLQARIGSSDGTTSRRENAYIDKTVTLDCDDIADCGLFTDNIQNSHFECLITNAFSTGVRDYFYGWGNRHMESVIGAGVVGKWLSFAGNGVHVGGAQIFGNPVEPSVAHIIAEGDCNGMNIDMGFVEKGVVGVLLRRAVGPINISGVDFEIFSSYAIDIDGSTVSGTRPCGPVTVTNCFLETSGTNAVIRVNNGILNVEGCRIRNTSGAAAAGLAAFEIIGSDSVVTERNNWIQPSIGNRFVSGLQSYTKSGRTHQRHVTQDVSTSLAVVDEQVVRSDPYNRALETTSIRSSSIVFNAGTQDVGSRLALTAQSHLAGATAGTSGFEIDATQGATYGMHPVADNTNQLGRAARRLSVVFAATATINTSDERAKENIGPILDKVLDAWGDVEWSSFVFTDAAEAKGDGARIHFGLIAQRVRDAFEAHGLDPFSFALLCYDKWEDEWEEWEDEYQDGELVRPAGRRKVTEAGDRFGIRYEEALALEAAWVRRELARMKTAKKASANKVKET